MKPTSRAVFLGALLAGAASVSAAGKWESVESVPGRTAETILVNKKPRAYFRVTPAAPLAISLAGPAQVRLISRVVLSGKAGEKASYRLAVSERGRELLSKDFKAGAARSVSAPGIAALGNSRRATVEIPAGDHELQVALSGAAAVLVRIQRAALAGADGWLSLTPVNAPRSVSLVEGQKSISYYSIFGGRPAVFRVTGPTTLDLLTRLDFDDTMRGEQTYRLRLTEHGNLVQESEFRTTKATAATYSNLSNRVPSKFDRVSLPIGSGVHDIEVHLVTPAKGSAEVHARIPQPSTGDTE
jgi:hypothetical protein